MLSGTLLCFKLKPGRASTPQPQPFLGTQHQLPVLLIVFCFKR